MPVSAFSRARNISGQLAQANDPVAVIGETRVIEQPAESDPEVREQAAALCREAIEALEDAGHDATEVKMRVSRCGDVQASNSAARL